MESRRVITTRAAADAASSPTTTHHLYPDLVDGRAVEGSSSSNVMGMEKVMKRAATVSRSTRSRSQSLVPDRAKEMRRAAGGLYSLHLKPFLPTTPSPQTQQQQQHKMPIPLVLLLFFHSFTNSSLHQPSLHKTLANTRSDPSSVLPRQCTSCGDGPDLCFAALGIHDHVQAASSQSSRRVHSLLRQHHRPMTTNRRPSTTLTLRHKPRTISEEEGSEANTPDSNSDAWTPDTPIHPLTKTHQHLGERKLLSRKSTEGQAAVTVKGEVRQDYDMSEVEGVVVARVRRMSI
ncbi:hypothetical protein Pcinc_031006 [Petrolisthes cinctipes]|uniref:Uncharacterized protein n=1 Tax=Petrolisthes cinctipes TaxID=88211 RepID=A0AAE1EXJ0_PETCI|nr:hypothetical protein Pcinc_031006 [Petrolisthes cinctipes]